MVLSAGRESEVVIGRTNDKRDSKGDQDKSAVNRSDILDMHQIVWI